MLKLLLALIVIAVVVAVVVALLRGKSSPSMPPAQAVPQRSPRDAHGNAPVPEWAPGLNAAQFDRFIEIVRAYFVSRYGEFNYDDGWIFLSLSKDEKPTQFGLTNLSQMCAQAPPDEWDEIVADHFHGVIDELNQHARHKEEFQSLEHARPYLRPRLWPIEAVGEVATIDDRLVARRDIPGTVTALVLDLPSAVRIVVREDTDQWALSDDELFKIAFSNLRESGDIAEPERTTTPEGAVLYSFISDSFVSASVALMLDEYPQTLGKHGALVGIPTRHFVIAHPVNDGSAVTAPHFMIPMISKFAEQGPGTISSHLYWYRDGSFIVLPYRITSQAIAFEPPQEFVEMLNNLHE